MRGPAVRGIARLTEGLALLAVVERLIDRYYEGHSAAEKQRALDMLPQLRKTE